ncbi:MAG TPA: T9SS type A sorting domain-containing protein [Balneolaceae bacterium]
MDISKYILLWLFLLFSNSVLAQNSVYNRAVTSDFSNEEVKKAASQVYAIPFVSQGNVLELTLINTTNKVLKNIEVILQNLPEWIKPRLKDKSISKLQINEGKTVIFSFDIDKKAPVGNIKNIEILATDGKGYKWSKSIHLKVAAPSKFKLLQNYPNPFNPTTTIEYLLPAEMKVKVTIYNILGRKVATLVDETQEAGRQELHWNADGMASGLYIYRVIADAENGKKIIQQRKMMLIK